MLKTVKTTTLATIAALTLAAGISTQANASTIAPSATSHAKVQTLAVKGDIIKVANFGHKSKFGYGYKSNYYYDSYYGGGFGHGFKSKGFKSRGFKGGGFKSRGFKGGGFKGKSFKKFKKFK